MKLIKWICYQPRRKIFYLKVYPEYLGRGCIIDNKQTYKFKCEVIPKWCTTNRKIITVKGHLEAILDIPMLKKCGYNNFTKKQLKKIGIEIPKEDIIEQNF